MMKTAMAAAGDGPEAEMMKKMTENPQMMLVWLTHGPIPWMLYICNKPFIHSAPHQQDFFGTYIPIHDGPTWMVYFYDW